MKSLLAIIPLLATALWAATPNIVLINADDLGYGDLSCYGATKLRTPHIDKLAAEGRRFTDAHSASAVCTPSRYALLTGEYPVRKNAYSPVFHRTGLLIDTDRRSIGGLLQDAGYATACIGKWHLGFGKSAPDWNGDLKPGPLEVGFDYYYGVPVVNSHPPFVYVENHRVVGLLPEDPIKIGRKFKAKTKLHPEKMGIVGVGGGDAAHALYDDEYVGTHLTEKAVDWIGQQSADKPFFLYLATTNIHHPFTPHPRFQGSSECGAYGDFVHELDWIVGEVVKALDKKGVTDNTLLIFTSDNGGMLNIGGQQARALGHHKNGKLLGFKFDAWEGGHRVPFIAKWPGKIPAGTSSDQLVSNIDMMATFSAITGTALEPDEGVDSVNILPALTGTPAVPVRDQLLLAGWKPSHLSLRDGKWMYIPARAGGGFTAPKRGGHAFGGPASFPFTGQENSDIEGGKLKPGAPPAQLYDLEADPYQANNVLASHPEVVEAMKRKRAAIIAGKPEPKEAAKPNVIVIFCDDMGYADIGPFGAKGYQTPHLDRMADEGLRLTSFMVTRSVCSPSRAGLLTGCYNVRVGVPGNFNPKSKNGLNPKEMLIPEVLKQVGYKTAAYGKWHLGHGEPFLPTSQGFDEWFGIPFSNDMWSHHPQNDRYKFGDLPLMEGPKIVNSALTPEDQTTLTKRFTERALSFIDKNVDNPFFVYLAHPQPHVPLFASKDFVGKTERGLYGDVISEIDWSVGQILQRLRDRKLDQRTLVIFTSDNGPWLWYGEHGGSAGKLRAGKGTVFEGGQRVPCLAWWPGKIPAGSQSNALASSMDILPTAAHLAGASLPERTIDGKNILPLLVSPEKARSPHRYFHYFAGSALLAVRKGPWKLVLPHRSSVITEPGRDGRPGARSNHQIPLSLFNLNSDVAESANLADANPKIVQELKEAANAMRKELAPKKDKRPKK
jgi:arylsulfatase A